MKLLSSFKKELILASRGLYFYIEILFAVIILGELAFGEKSVAFCEILGRNAGVNSDKALFCEHIEIVPVVWINDDFIKRHPNVCDYFQRPCLFHWCIPPTTSLAGKLLENLKTVQCTVLVVGPLDFF